MRCEPRLLKPLYDREILGHEPLSFASSANCRRVSYSPLPHPALASHRAAPCPLPQPRRLFSAAHAVTSIAPLRGTSCMPCAGTARRRRRPPNPRTPPLRPGRDRPARPWPDAGRKAGPHMEEAPLLPAPRRGRCASSPPSLRHNRLHLSIFLLLPTGPAISAAAGSTGRIRAMAVGSRPWRPDPSHAAASRGPSPRPRSPRATCSSFARTPLPAPPPRPARRSSSSFSTIGASPVLLLLHLLQVRGGTQGRRRRGVPRGCRLLRATWKGRAAARGSGGVVPRGWCLRRRAGRAGPASAGCGGGVPQGCRARQGLRARDAWWRSGRPVPACGADVGERVGQGIIRKQMICRTGQTPLGL
ncbi:hypothetical protein BS78_10G238600 [Paspalum vaginatum]|nr:hypothetical protein BS78_10G238600 [Paspalum vaginatum]